MSFDYKMLRMLRIYAYTTQISNSFKSRLPPKTKLGEVNKDAK